MSGLTKIFIVLQLVFSLVVSVLLVLMVSKVEPYQKQLNDLRTSNVALTATVSSNDARMASLTAANGASQKALDESIATAAKAQTELAAKLAASERGRLDAESKNAQLVTQVTSIGTTVSTQQELIKQKDSELEKLRPVVASLTEKNAEINRVNNDLTNGLRSANNAIDRLKEANAQAESAPRSGAVAPGAGSGGGQVTLLAGSQTAVQINGKVTDVGHSAGRTEIETGLGSRDGVKVNTKFAIYRNNNYVGDALVQRVTPEASVAVVTITKAGETVQKGDLVQSGD